MGRKHQLSPQQFLFTVHCSLPSFIDTNISKRQFSFVQRTNGSLTSLMTILIFFQKKYFPLEPRFEIFTGLMNALQATIFKNTFVFYWYQEIILILFPLHCSAYTAIDADICFCRNCSNRSRVIRLCPCLLHLSADTSNLADIINKKVIDQHFLTSLSHQQWYEIFQSLVSATIQQQSSPRPHKENSYIVHKLFTRLIFPLPKKSLWRALCDRKNLNTLLFGVQNGSVYLHTSRSTGRELIRILLMGFYAVGYCRVEGSLFWLLF